MIRGFAEGPWMLARTDRRSRQRNGGTGLPDVDGVEGDRERGAIGGAMVAEE